jgi:hypothetical protein
LRVLAGRYIDRDFSVVKLIETHEEQPVQISRMHIISCCRKWMNVSLRQWDSSQRANHDERIG